MKIILLIGIISSISAFPTDDLKIHSDHDCWINDNNTITKTYAVRVQLSSKFMNEKDTCSVRISNPWSSDMQNGFGVFVPRPIDCFTTVTIECLSGSTLVKQSTPPSIQYTCHTNSSEIEMPCSLIGLTFKRNSDQQILVDTTNIQIIALAKEPCVDKDILFRCPRDYPHSCLDRKLQCNGRVECPSGDDERACYHSRPAYIPTTVIIFLVLGFLFLVCILSTIAFCCCCRATCHAIIRRFHPSKRARPLQKGEMAIVTGEDAGLMKGLAAPSVIEALPQRPTEPTPLMIDSTKPIYPRL